MLMSAERPVMLLGGGVILADACEEFVALAEYLQIPVVTLHGQIRDPPLPSADGRTCGDPVQYTIRQSDIP